MELVYKIDSANDREGNLKELPSEWTDGEFFIHFAMVGRRAMLAFRNIGKTLETSTVRDISLWENGVKITTNNTVYYLQPLIKE